MDKKVLQEKLKVAEVAVTHQQQLVEDLRKNVAYLKSCLKDEKENLSRADDELMRLINQQEIIQCDLEDIKWEEEYL